MPAILSNEVIREIQSLRGQGFSVKEIGLKVNASRGSISKYIQSIQLTENQLGRLRQKDINNQFKSGINNPKSKTINPQVIESIEKVRIISHILFDGFALINNKQKSFGFTCSSPQVTQQFIDDIKLVYGLEKYYETTENTKGCKTITYCATEALMDLSQYLSKEVYRRGKGGSLCSKIPKIISEGSKEFKREFLLCFWSDEGGLSFNHKKKKFSLVGTQVSIPFLKEIAQLHDEFDILHHVYEKKYQIVISKNSEKYKFYDEIGFLEGSLVTRGKYIGREKNDLLREMLF